jgi:hypothetical protein
MEHAIIVSFEGDRNLTGLSVRPIDVIRDMIEDAEVLGYEVDYCVERDAPDRAAISYRCVVGRGREHGSCVGCQHGLIFRAISPAIKNHPSSLQALRAFATGEIEKLSIDFMDSNGKVPLAIVDLVESSYSFPEDDIQVIVHVEQTDGIIVRFVRAENPEEDEDEIFFHPYNSSSLLTLPFFVMNFQPGVQMSLPVKTVTVQSGAYTLWTGQALYVPYRKMTALHERKHARL